MQPLDGVARPMPYTVHKLNDYSEETMLRAVVQFRLALKIEWFEIEQKIVNPDLTSAARQDELKKFRDRWLSRKSGQFSQINELWLKNAPADRKKSVGHLINQLKQNDLPQIEQLIEKRGFFARQSSDAILSINRIFDDEKGRKLQQETLVTQSRMNSLLQTLESLGSEELQKIAIEEFHVDLSEALEAAAKSKDLAAERLDITLPGIRRTMGAEHPVIKTMNEIIGVFRNLGYSVEEGPEIETDYYNFEALNFPPDHPARDTQDTLFIAGQESKPLRDRLLLRTHTSPVQIRTMQKMKP